jgi:hypothetical protein
VPSPGKNRQLSAGNQAQHLRRVVDADEVAVSDEQQYGRSQLAELIGRPAGESGDKRRSR